MSQPLIPTNCPLSNPNENGLTLIEVVLYLALFVILMGELLTVTYRLSSSAQTARQKSQIQEEANLIIHKLWWTIETNQILSPLPGQTSSQLVLREPNQPSKMTISVIDNQLQIQNPNDGPTSLTPESMIVSDFIASQNSVPPVGMTIQFKLNNEPYSFTVYSTP